MHPMNWSSAKKTTAIVIVTSMTLLSYVAVTYMFFRPNVNKLLTHFSCRPIGSTINSSATLDILAHFKSTNETLGSFVTTVFLLGYTFGPLLIAPLSELYGRAILYKTCMCFFAIFNVACAVANSLGSLVVFRFLAGIMGSCPVTLGASSIADMVPSEKRTGAMGAYVLGVALGPSIGPIVGGFLTPAAGWRWTFWLMAIASGAMAVVAVLFVCESYPYVLLERKTKRLRKHSGNKNLRSGLSARKTPGELLAFSILRPLKMLLSPIIFLLSFYAAVVYSYLYICFTTFEVVFGGQYGFNSGEAGLATLGLGLGSILGVVGCGLVTEKVFRRLVKKHGGDLKPEYRLPPMVVGALCTPIGLFWYGWSAEAKAHWIVPIIGTVFIGMGMVFTYVRPPLIPILYFWAQYVCLANVVHQMSSAMYLVDAYTAHAASVTAASTVFRCLLGALLPLAGPSMYNALGLGWGNTLFGFISIAFIPLPVIFFLYGHRIREAKLFNIDF